MFLTGPGVVRRSWARTSTPPALGGATCTSATASPPRRRRRPRRRAAVRDLLDYLPQHAGEDPEPHSPAAPEPGRPGRRRARATRARSTTSATSSRASSTAAACSRSSRAGRATWSCAFARLDGRAVGIIANQPRYLGGVLDADVRAEGARASCAPATRSACRWSCSSTRRASCPGPSQEQPGVIRHGAKLLHAFAEGEVPKLTVVLRKAFGGAYIAMNSKDLGADLSFAWPQAELGVMGAAAGGRDRPPPRARGRRRPRGRARPAGRRLRRRAPERARRGRRRPRRRDHRARRHARAPGLGPGDARRGDAGSHRPNIPL